MQILIIEDKKSKLRLMKDIFENEIGVPANEISVALNLESAKRIISEHFASLKIIVFDGRVPLSELNYELVTTIALVEETAKNGFLGLMIANSGDLNNSLLVAGCNIAFDSVMFDTFSIFLQTIKDSLA
ncbi:TPA: hypothetical protein DD449_03450 [Candidatus Berkelbacteria bacterium]|uniref:Uncharacterized protein n=1 Tax=Berkelbacteria bacterium GW2011_GWE1_39_12 TaxID=1618337 RepID=A0A0G4B2E3_9BACT|nr:MAG: hypothetical protein UT28_C0001G0322 [Berkelbacteria bacterium GW2011_GWE1_39_12]HBO60713.1 hypothetical protein [Candidatus Berkelbacteria bacterium]